jgi:DNA-binding CsgD family transcriptional regulator
VRSAFRTSFVAMAVMDDERRVVEANVAACLQLRMPARALHGMRIDDLVAPQLLARLPEDWERFLRDGARSGDYELRPADGTRLAIDCSAAAHILPGLHFCAWLPASNGAAPGTARRVSEREREVLQLVAQGASVEEIGLQLMISPNTVRTHLRNARQKLGAASRAHAVALAYGTGLLTPPD